MHTLDINRFYELKSILEQDSNEELDIWESMGRLFINGMNSKLMIRFNNYMNTITIAKIALKNKKVGIGTRILQWIEDFAKQNNYNTIIIESTTTHEINQFAIKHGFKPIQHQGMYYEGEFFGNWEKCLT